MPEIRLILIIIGVVVVLGVWLWGRRRNPEQQALEEDWLEELARRKREGISHTRKTVPARRVAPGLGQRAAETAAPDTSDLPPMSARPQQPPKTAAPNTPARPTQPAATPASSAAAHAARVEKPVAKPAPPKKPVAKKAGSAPAAPEAMILVLFIMAHRGKTLEGMDIVAAARQINLQLSEMNVFQWYEDPDSQQDPVFTLASMLEPGSFDLEHMEHFETPGLALFCQLPTVISGSAAFEKMLAVGRHMAQALNAELKDETRSTLTLQTIGHIREKVKNFDFRQQQLRNPH